MSHVTTIKTEISDLEALKSACKELNVEFVEYKNTYCWYGTHIGDYPIPEGLTKELLGKCDHVIKVPGVKYEVGIVRQPNGKFTLAYDFWGPGQGLLKKFGDNCGKLMQLYAVHKATKEARKRGHSVKRKNQANGTIKLTIIPH